jgi:hypothetical protein
VISIENVAAFCPYYIDGGHSWVRQNIIGAHAMPGILPELSVEESLEVTRIYSVADVLPLEMMIRTRPFHSPHHTISHAGLVGGGNRPHPGEFLSHIAAFCF